MEIEKMDIKTSKVGRPGNSQLIDIALNVFGRNRSTFKFTNGKSPPDNFAICDLLGKTKALINPVDREVIYYNSKYEKRVDTLLDRYCDITQEGHWTAIPPKSKFIQKLGQTGHFY